MELYILRHGIAEEATGGMADKDRALTEGGRDRLRRVLSRAHEAGVAPSLILTSPYRRALETAQLAAPALGSVKVTRCDALVPASTPEEVWEVIREHRKESGLLLAGHEPLLSQTAAYLLGAPDLQIDLKKAAMVRIDLESFSGTPRGILKWMLTPGLA
jgi:phosphohistidine phosphatase